MKNIIKYLAVTSLGLSVFSADALAGLPYTSSACYSPNIDLKTCEGTTKCDTACSETYVIGWNKYNSEKQANMLKACNDSLAKKILDCKKAKATAAAAAAAAAENTPSENERCKYCLDAGTSKGTWVVNPSGANNREGCLRTYPNNDAAYKCLRDTKTGPTDNWNWTEASSTVALDQQKNNCEKPGLSDRAIQALIKQCSTPKPVTPAPSSSSGNKNNTKTNQ